MDAQGRRRRRAQVDADHPGEQGDGLPRAPRHEGVLGVGRHRGRSRGDVRTAHHDDCLGQVADHRDDQPGRHDDVAAGPTGLRRIEQQGIEQRRGVGEQPDRAVHRSGREVERVARPHVGVEHGEHRGLRVAGGQRVGRVGEPGPRRVGAQAPAVRVQRRVRRVADVDGQLSRVRGPGDRQPAGERHVAEQGVGHADALAARQPRRDERLDPRQLIGHELRATGDDEHDARHGPAHGVDRGAVGDREVEAAAVVADVPHPLGVRRLTDDDDADVGPRHGRRGVLRVRHGCRRCDLADALKDRGPRRGVAGAALPGDRPATHLVTEVVGVRAGDVDVRVLRERQQVVRVLEQHLRARRGVPRHGAVLDRAEVGRQGPVRQRGLEQPEGELLGKDARDGVVDPGLGDGAVGDLLGDRRDECPVVVRRHGHVEARVDGPRGLVGVRAAGQLVDALPVADQEPVEAELALEEVVVQRGVLVHAHRTRACEVDRGVGRHERARPRLDRGDVRRDVHPEQLGEGLDVRHALVDRVAGARERRLVPRAGVTDPVLDGREHLGRPGQVGRVRALEPDDGGRRQRGHERRVLAEGLVAAAPPLVPRGAEQRRERPRDAGRPDLGRGDLPGRLDQAGVARGTEAGVVRHDRRPDHVVVPVHGVDAVDQRDLQPCRQRLTLIPVDHVRPAGRGVVRRDGAAAGQQRPEREARDVAFLREAQPLGLRHLADLLGLRHAAEEVGDPLGGRQRCVEVGRTGRVDHDPRGADDVGALGGEGDLDRAGVVGRTGVEGLDRDRLLGARRRPGVEREGAPEGQVVGRRDGGVRRAGVGVGHRDRFDERGAVGRGEPDRDLRGLARIDEVDVARRRDLGGRRGDRGAVQRDVVDRVADGGGVADRHRQRVAPRRGEVERAVLGRGVAGLVAADGERVERELDELPAAAVGGPVVLEGRGPQLGVLAVGPAVLELDLDVGARGRRRRAVVLRGVPEEPDSAERAPVLRRGEVVAEAAPVADGHEEVAREHVVAGGDAVTIHGGHAQAHLRAGGTPAEESDGAARGGDRDVALEVLDQRRALVERDVVELPRAGAEVGQRDREAAGRGRVEPRVGRRVALEPQECERCGDLAPTGGVVDHGALEHLTVALELVAQRAARARPEEPEAEAVLAGPVGGRGEVVREAEPVTGVRGTRDGGLQHLVAGGRTVAIDPDSGQRRGDRAGDAPGRVAGRDPGLEVVEDLGGADVGQVAVRGDRHRRDRAPAQEEAGGRLGQREVEGRHRRQRTVVDGRDCDVLRRGARGEGEHLVDSGIVGPGDGRAAARGHAHREISGRRRCEGDGDGRRLTGGDGRSGAAEHDGRLLRGAVDLERKQGVAVPVRPDRVPGGGAAGEHGEPDVARVDRCGEREVVTGAVAGRLGRHRAPARGVGGIAGRDLHLVGGRIRGLPREVDPVHGHRGAQVDLQPCGERDVGVRSVAARPTGRRVGVDRVRRRERAVDVVLRDRRGRGARNGQVTDGGRGRRGREHAERDEQAQRRDDRGGAQTGRTLHRSLLCEAPRRQAVGLQ